MKVAGIWWLLVWASVVIWSMVDFISEYIERRKHFNVLLSDFLLIVLIVTLTAGFHGVCILFVDDYKTWWIDLIVTLHNGAKNVDNLQ